VKFRVRIGRPNTGLLAIKLIRTSSPVVNVATTRFVGTPACRSKASNMISLFPYNIVPSI
jgi:hypothetical protein